jgi:23S rRNA pseudoU1915 N3-methylase RlmH
MKILFLTVGKAHEPHVKEGIELFTKRLSNYFPVQWQIVPMPKNAAALSEIELRRKPKKRPPERVKQPLTYVTSPNQVWSLDFMTDFP